jgi:hypothetical protein
MPLPVKFPRQVQPEEEWNPKYLRQIQLLSMMGHDAQEIALVLGVRQRVFDHWVRDKYQVQIALCAGTAKAVAQVEEALFLRATGYEHDETKLFYDRENGGVVREDVVKHYPPDPDAIKFFLKNRAPQRWSDKREDIMPVVNVDNRSVTITATNANDAVKEYMKLIQGDGSG